MVYLGKTYVEEPEKGIPTITYKYVNYIKRSLWQKLFGVKCPSCGEKMFEQLTYYNHHKMYCCNKCLYIVKDYGEDNP